jgi:hypothetical protein
MRQTVPGGSGPRHCSDSVTSAMLRKTRTCSVDNFFLSRGVWTPKDSEMHVPNMCLIDSDLRDEERRLISRGTRRNDSAAGRKRGCLER